MTWTIVCRLQWPPFPSSECRFSSRRSSPDHGEPTALRLPAQLSRSPSPEPAASLVTGTPVVEEEPQFSRHRCMAHRPLLPVQFGAVLHCTSGRTGSCLGTSRSQAGSATSRQRTPPMGRALTPRSPPSITKIITSRTRTQGATVCAGAVGESAATAASYVHQELETLCLQGLRWQAGVLFCQRTPRGRSARFYPCFTKRDIVWAMQGWIRTVSI